MSSPVSFCTEERDSREGRVDWEGSIEKRRNLIIGGTKSDAGEPEEIRETGQGRVALFSHSSSTTMT